jgi:hypothetical protein
VDESDPQEKERIEYKRLANFFGIKAFTSTNLFCGAGGGFLW